MQFVQVDVGGSLHLDVTDVGDGGVLWDASPAPTVILYFRSGGQLRASASATAGSTWTLSSAAAADGRSIPLATTGSITRWAPDLLLKGADSRWEWITPEAVASGVLTAVEPLENSYASADTLRSPRLQTTVLATTVTTPEHGCFAEWTYYVGGQKRKEFTTFTISRYVPRLNVSSREITAYDARAANLIGSDQDLDRLIRMVWDRRVLIDVAKILGTPGAVIAGEVLDEALTLRVLADLYTRAGTPDSMEIGDRYEARYGQAIDAIRESVVDLDESGGQSEDEVPRSRTSVRMWRG